MNMELKRDLRVNVHDANFRLRSCGSVSSSFSTDHSVYTPTSGRSSPLYSDPAAFEQCFSQTSSLPYGFSPASSVTSQEYHGMPGLSWEFGSTASSFVETTPATPARCNSTGNGQLLVPDSAYLHYTPTPASNMNFDIVFTDPFSPNTFVTPSRTFYVPPGHSSPGDMPAWPVLESSPMDYRQRQVSRQPLKRESSQLHFRDQAGMGQVQQKSAALQEVALPRIHKAARMKKRPSSKEEGRDGSVPPRKGMIPCVETTTVQKARLPCPWKGCSAAFSRSEHLTRHYDGKHLLKIAAICRCCADQGIAKEFDRHDNYLTHLALHVTGNGRVKYHPDAGRLYDEEQAKIKRRAPSKKQQVHSRKMARPSQGGPIKDREARHILMSKSRNETNKRPSFAEHDVKIDWESGSWVKSENE